MQALVRSYTLNGIEALPVEVQVSIDDGYPTTTIVGLPNQAVQESMDRIWAAFHSCGFSHPNLRLTVNLAPAELRKEGSSFDLPIALGILAAMEAFPAERIAGLTVAGELALNGEVRSIRGALAMALASARLGRRDLLLPALNLAEASDVPGVTPRPLRSLADAIDRLRNDDWSDHPVAPSPHAGRPTADSNRAVDLNTNVRSKATAEWSAGVDFAQVRGQTGAKRALEVAAAGGHNLLMVGPPGAGKTLLAQRLPTILPALSAAEALEVTLIHSVVGLLGEGRDRIRVRPFRSPHHTVSGPGLVGGGANPRPGEISLAHDGVLFLDEMPEFRPPVLNLLRQPLEDGWVRIVRSGRVVTFPCRFMLVGAMNP